MRPVRAPLWVANHIKACLRAHAHTQACACTGTRAPVIEFGSRAITARGVGHLVLYNRTKLDWCKPAVQYSRPRLMEPQTSSHHGMQLAHECIWPGGSHRIVVFTDVPVLIPLRHHQCTCKGIRTGVPPSDYTLVTLLPPLSDSGADYLGCTHLLDERLASAAHGRHVVIVLQRPVNQLHHQTSDIASPIL